jgi:cytochrome P450
MFTAAVHLRPPGPVLPAMAQALRWVGRPYEFMRECARDFGDVFSLQLGANANYVVVSRPEAIRAIFTADAEVLRVGSGNAVLKPFLGPGSLLVLEGERHLRERRLIMPAFHNKAIAKHGEIIREALLGATSEWREGHEFVAQEVMQGVSVNVILRAVFGLRGPEDGADLKRELVSFLNDKRFNLGLLAQLDESDPRGALDTFRGQFERIGQLTKALVIERRRNPRASEGDMLSMLLDATDEDGRGRTDDELRDELLTLVATGYETTATALSWGVYWIAERPAVKERLRAELAGLGRRPETKDYGQLEYLDATCKEILRIYPIVPAVFREVVQPFRIGDYVFDPGTILSPSVYLTHRRDDLYEHPEDFDPDRFLRRSYSPYEYLPFGGGARRCIGISLAVHEMKIILATLLERFELGVAAGQRVAPVRRSVTMGPSGGPRMVVEHAYS